MFSSIYKRYVPAIEPENENNGSAWVFAFDSNKILVIESEETVKIPKLKELEEYYKDLNDKLYLGEVEGQPCYCMEIANDTVLPENMAFKEMRSLLGTLDEDIFMLLGRAFSIMNWNRMNKFCGKCGTLTQTNKNERSKFCPECGSVFYPRISPAVITAIVKDNKILLAHNKNFKGKRHSVIAGFVETGETFEDCVKRETMEEVGIRVKNIKYFGSQPWPFPDSLMVGFTAEYDSGEIKVDGVEIDHADWYSKEEIPEVPGTVSIAGHLIKWFADNH